MDSRKIVDSRKNSGFEKDSGFAKKKVDREIDNGSIVDSRMQVDSRNIVEIDNGSIVDSRNR